MSFFARTIVVALCGLAVAGLSASVSLGATTHVFDPVLSLTGGCTVSPVDTIPDPGCDPPTGNHPPASFSGPRSITADDFGNLYVVNFGSENAASRIDIFDSGGFYIDGSELSAPGAIQAAVDGDGVLYVLQLSPIHGQPKLSRYSPTTYNPADGELAYGAPPVVIQETFSGTVSIAVNPVDDHLFVNEGQRVTERGSVSEGNAVLDSTIGAGVLGAALGASIAVDVAHNRLYASDTVTKGGGSTPEGAVRVFALTGPHALLDTFDGSATPKGKFGIQPSVAVDEGTGNLFVYDGGGGSSEEVHEFDGSGSYVSRISYGVKGKAVEGTAKIWVDNGLNSPNGVMHPEGRYLFVPATGDVGHTFAFGPSGEIAPEIESVSFGEVTRVDAELRGFINPGNVATTYAFEYTTQQLFEQQGFDGAPVAGTGNLPALTSAIPVSAPALGLSPGTTYRFRLLATNDQGPAVPVEGEFTTYPAAIPLPSCANDPTRTGLSALLPDCRAYELVTPSDTNARSPLGLAYEGLLFGSLQASPDGGRISFNIEGGTLPGNEGTGSLNGDRYLSSRGADGWSTAAGGPTGAEAVQVTPGSSSPDQGYSFWVSGVEGSATVGGKETTFIRYPDGHSEVVGRGSIGEDTRARGRLISAGGSHIIVETGDPTGSNAVRLEPEAPPSGTRAIYDRTSDGITHVVSLLPGNVTPSPGQNALFQGGSFDGNGVAFLLGGELYLRYENEETFKIGEGAAAAGVANGGNRIFYLQGGKLLRFDAATGQTTPFNATGTVTPVNVSGDGSAAYLASTSVLTNQANPNGVKAKAGQQNLYLSREGSISFVGTVTEADMGGEGTAGLGTWASASRSGRFAIALSRTTPDGSVLVFESEANLAGYDPEGSPQVYRYDSTANELTCLSCNPTGAAPTGTANLQSIGRERGLLEPLNFFSRLTNLSPDGRRAFFQSTEALVPEDTDGLQDVYEWEAEGVGSCTRAGGCINLISSGQSERIDYLYAVSESGDDVFFRTSDRLLPADTDETPSIYDARVGGGFPEEPASCGDQQVCREGPPPPPNLASPVTNAGEPSATKPKRCGKGKHRVKRNGKARCVKKKQRHKAGATKKGGRK